MPVFGQTRAALAAAAARGADIVSSLRLVMTAEALTAPVPGLALELNTELEVLCDACRELAACRSGWLYLCPAGDVQPAALPRGLLHGVVLSFLRGVLRSGGRAVIRVLPHGEAVVLTLQGGRPDRMPGDLPALLHRCGAYVTTGDGGRYAAAVRLAPAQGLPLREAPALAELLLDRYSAPRVYLQGFCVEEE
ncbi:hypothetical protein [uncultured Gemmiger sp.]|uniref:hypothetical protein n=1 Tax=uncultured Gemmiger sp. TaxID=1623490 RepID=UPI0025E25125|nr:hypothetical protein [uncultured Gemmiger sp.]